MQINIDNRIDKHITGFTNYVDFDSLLNKLPTTITELQINGQVLNTLSIAQFTQVFSKILPLLKTGSTLYVESLDINVFCRAIACGSIALDEINRTLFDGKIKGVYNLIALEHLLIQNGFETHAKGYEGLRFHLTMHRP